MAYLIGLGVVLLLLVFILLVRISALVDVLRSKKDEDVAVKQPGNALNGALLMLFGFALVGAFFYLNSKMEPGYLPEAVSEHGVRVDNLMMITIIVMAIVFVLVNLVLFTFSFMYRGNSTRKAYFYAHNDRLELIWTIIPAIVLAILVFYGWRVWSGMMAEAPKDALVFEITGKQFNWIVRHPGSDKELGDYNYRKIDAINQVGIDYSDKASFDDIMPKELHVPVNTPVKLNIRSRDVLHNVFLPHFRIKMDAVPGIVNTIWFVPTKTTAEMREEMGDQEFNYEIVCNQICGRGHFGMRSTIVVDSKEDYQEWLAQQEPFLEKNPDFMEEVPEALKADAQRAIEADKVALNK